PFLTQAGLQPSDLTAFKDEVLFNGLDDNGQYGLWTTDGTAAGTHELTGITGAYSVAYSFRNGFFPSDLTVFGDEVLFNGRDDQGNYGLWTTDGTAAGTYELANVSPTNLTVFNDKVLFASGNGLWVTDGTASGTHELNSFVSANDRLSDLTA